MRKGVSQIISSVLLLAIAVSIGGIYSQWAPDFSEMISQDAADRSNDRIKCSNAGINIENAKYDISGQLAELELSNTGTIRFNADIQVAAMNSSQISGSTTVSELDVEETELVTLRSEKVPEKIIASVTGEACPGLSIETSQIAVTE